MKDKIYLVRILDKRDNEVWQDSTFCYRNRENAKAEFDKLCKDAEPFKKSFNTHEIDENSFELYNEGFYEQDCFCLNLEEYFIED